MPTLARRFIRTALVFLIVGMLVGLLMLYRREVMQQWPVAHLITAHTHAVFIGFVLFMILGVALWMFPRPLANDKRFKPIWVETSYWLLLFGTVLRFVGEVARIYDDNIVLIWLVFATGVAQVTGVTLYVWTMWSRIRPAKRVLRKLRGEADS